MTSSIEVLVYYQSLFAQRVWECISYYITLKNVETHSYDNFFSDHSSAECQWKLILSDHIDALLTF